MLKASLRNSPEKVGAKFARHLPVPFEFYVLAMGFSACSMSLASRVQAVSKPADCPYVVTSTASDASEQNRNTLGTIDTIETYVSPIHPEIASLA